MHLHPTRLAVTGGWTVFYHLLEVLGKEKVVRCCIHRLTDRHVAGSLRLFSTGIPQSNCAVPHLSFTRRIRI